MKLWSDEGYYQEVIVQREKRKKDGSNVLAQMLNGDVRGSAEKEGVV